jgi:hypothetical protein
LKLMPSERTSRHTDTGQVAMPCSASSATSAFSVRSGTALSRSITSARCAQATASGAHPSVAPPHSPLPADAATTSLHLPRSRRTGPPPPGNSAPTPPTPPQPD